MMLNGKAWCQGGSGHAASPETDSTQVLFRQCLRNGARDVQIALDDEGSFMLVEDESDRVMPPRRAVMAAGRYDLHHAIQYHGGYLMVLVPRL